MPVPISYPANYAPGMAIGFANPNGDAVVVSSASPMPVVVSAGSSQPVVLAGSTSASTVTPALVAGPGQLVLALSGTWTGTVTVQRSTDGGATKLPLTVAGSPWGVFTGNCCEPVWEESEGEARYYLAIVVASGTVTYRLAQ